MRKFWKEKGVESGRGARKGKETKRRIEGNVSCWREPSTMLQQSTAHRMVPMEYLKYHHSLSSQ